MTSKAKFLITLAIALMGVLMIALIVSAQAQTIEEILENPEGWIRQKPGEKKLDFDRYIQNLNFTLDGPVVDYEGYQLKHAYATLDVGPLTSNMQCADIVMKLYGDFNQFNNQITCFTPYSGLSRCDVENTHEDYMQWAYNNCNTYTLQQYDSRPVSMQNIRVGDVLLNGDVSPGHVLLIVDVIRKGDRTKVALLQGFMPAQTPHIVDMYDEVYFELQDTMFISGYNFVLNKHLRRLRY